MLRADSSLLFIYEGRCNGHMHSLVCSGMVQSSLSFLAFPTLVMWSSLISFFSGLVASLLHSQYYLRVLDVSYTLHFQCAGFMFLSILTIFCDAVMFAYLHLQWWLYDLLHAHSCQDWVASYLFSQHYLRFLHVSFYSLHFYSFEYDF